MNDVAGTLGYEDSADRFLALSRSLDFFTVCHSFVPYLPQVGAHVLDVGAGAGQNAAALARVGYTVTAIEPLQTFLTSAKEHYSDLNIQWRQDFLPVLNCLDNNTKFEFVLVEGMWHHLNERERELSATRLAEIVKPSGVCAISLRHGPAGLGTCVHPIDREKTIVDFQAAGFNCIHKSVNQSSYLPNKENVRWDRIVLEKT
ncbi:MAG: methyltransferase domain-containing protein [Pseudomonadota bacterium]